MREKQQPPVLLAHRSLPAMSPAASRGNVAWNDDGQCMYITKRGVVILTPYLVSTLPPPPDLIDPNTTFEYPIAPVKDKGKAPRVKHSRDDSIEMMDTPHSATPYPGESSEAGPSTSTLGRVGKPRETLKWWGTGLEVDRDAQRDWYYQWTDAGDEYSGILSGKEVFVKHAEWSPSGLNEMGGCLLAVLTTHGQVSVYTPRSNPYLKQWDEVADLTASTRSMLEEQQTTVSIVSQMRTVCMTWSSGPSESRMLGNDGSLLALANRAGKISLWSYGVKHKFECGAYLKVTDGWVNNMAWSTWELVDGKYQAHLAMAMSDGSIASVAVQRSVKYSGNEDQPPEWDLTFGKMQAIDATDRRVITAVKWVDSLSLLVWAKSGSISMWSSRDRAVNWQGVRTVRLDRVGNWAGANPLGTCIGIESLDRDRLLITLSALTTHLIIDLTTNPKLAPPADALRISLITRDVALDNLRIDRKLQGDERQLSIVTSGFTGIGDTSRIFSWASEYVNLHNLDAANEGVRSMSFVLADLSGILPEAEDILDPLNRVLDNPPSLLSASPVRVLMPYMLRILARSDLDSLTRDLVELCSTESRATAVPEKDSAPVDISNPDELLMRSLWMSKDLDSMRLRAVLIQWTMKTFPRSVQELEHVLTELRLEILKIIMQALAGWLEVKLEADSLSNLSDEDQRLVVAMPLPSELKDRITAPDTLGHEVCPACKEPIEVDEGDEVKCSRGHDWARCCLTRRIIDTPSHRICSVCPAASNLPERYRQHPIPVDKDGTSRDWQRFSSTATAHEAPPNTTRGGGNADGDVTMDGMDEMNGADRTRVQVRGGSHRSLAQLVLEVGVACPMCGGRWTRVA